VRLQSVCQSSVVVYQLTAELPGRSEASFFRQAELRQSVLVFSISSFRNGAYSGENATVQAEHAITNQMRLCGVLYLCFSVEMMCCGVSALRSYMHSVHWTWNVSYECITCAGCVARSKCSYSLVVSMSFVRYALINQCRVESADLPGQIVRI